MVQTKKRFNKKLYIYLALVTMGIVSLLAKPIKKGFYSLNKRLQSASNKKSLKVQLGLAQQDFSPIETKPHKKAIKKRQPYQKA